MKKKKTKEKIENLSQGAKAVKSGESHEDSVCGRFAKNNVPVIYWEEYIKMKQYYDTFEELVIRQYRFKRVNGKNGKLDIFYKSLINGNVCIECKNQTRGGSADDKYDTMVADAFEAYPSNNTFLVVDGHGYAEGARQRIADIIERGFVDGTKYKNPKIAELQKEAWELIKKEKNVRLMYTEEIFDWIDSLNKNKKQKAMICS